MMLIPLAVLLAVFFISIPIVQARKGYKDLGLSARLGLSAMLLFTGASHFFMTNTFTAMVPPGVPSPKLVVYLTGAFEILAAIGLHIKPFRKITAWLLILFFVAVLPANIYATNHLAKAGGEPRSFNYLWVRIPLQIYFILFTYFSSLWKGRKKQIHARA